MSFFFFVKMEILIFLLLQLPPPQEILLVRISSLTKSKTHGNFLGQPVFLFVKEEFLTREKSSWEGGGTAWAMSFSLNQRGYPHEEKVLMGERREVESPGRISQNDILLKFPLGFFSLSMRKPLHSFLLAQGNSPREDFLFDEEKNSWQHSRTAMSFSLRQRRNSHERKILLGVWGGGVESNEFFSSSKRKSSRGKNPRGRGGEEMEVTRENISKWYSIEVSMRFFTSSKRKSSYPLPLPPPPHEEILPMSISSLTKRKLVANSYDNHEFFSSSKN